jgi:hypothetical protein
MNETLVNVSLHKKRNFTTRLTQRPKKLGKPKRKKNETLMTLIQCLLKKKTKKIKKFELTYPQSPKKLRPIKENRNVNKMFH